MDPQSLQARWSAGETVGLLDVREPEELAVASVGPARHIPLGSLMDRVGELEDWRDQNFAVICHHGVRSAHAVGYLRSVGFDGAENLNGGIDRWSVEVDPTVPRY